ncbi:MAG TPA: periplasmic heavy metal sensor [Thermoanaerobaculia bacterium]|nr:periplasmic heavy metal sensor [Thermoanaerobaculia bacterium]
MPLLFLAIMPPVCAQESLPQGKWWNRPEIVRQLNLTPQQQTRLDNVFRRHADGLIDLRAEVQKRSIDLRSELDRQQLDREAIQQAAKRVGSARSDLFERELLLLVDMRAELTAEQWNRFRRVLNVREGAARRQEQRRNPR